MVKIELERINEFSAFDAKDENGHIVKIDTKPDMGGQNYGVRPMQLLLMGLGGCSGVDILSILKKQRQEVKDFKISIEADREAGVEPSLWTDINVVFYLEGNIDQDKAEKACALSMDKYCSVAATLNKAGSSIKWKVVINK
jgi:putative redox protein